MPYVNPFLQPYINKYVENQAPPAFVYKDYNINIGGIGNGEHARISKIYEDLMPSPEIYASYKTLKERIGLNHHIKGAFVQQYEGEMVNFTNGSNNLCERLKLTKQSPYSCNYFSLNPYDSTPKNMLIYGSSYPIVFDKNTLNTKKADKSTELIVRVYGLTKEEIDILYQTSSTPTTKTINEFDVFRERLYYDFVMKDLGNTGKTPNFIYPYCWFMNEDAMSNFETRIYDNDNPLCKKKQYTFCKSIIMLTEAPTFNIYTWASNVYSSEKNVMVQSNTGFKSYETWKSIIFQMVVVFYIMYKLKFVFNEMNIEKNFYIKEYGTVHEKNYYNIYKIDDIEYFVPTYSYLLLFDSDFHDISTTPKLEAPKKQSMPLISTKPPIPLISSTPSTTPTISDDNKYKFISDSLGNNENNIYDKICENASNIFNRVNFNDSSIFKTKYKGVPPDEQTLKLFDDVGNIFKSRISGTMDDMFKNIFNICFYDYLNNRIGSEVKESEAKQLIDNSDGLCNFNKGDLIAIPSKKFLGAYSIGLYIDKTNYISDISKSITSYATYTDILDIKKFISNNSIYQDVKKGEPHINFNYLGETYDLKFN